MAAESGNPSPIVMRPAVNDQAAEVIRTSRADVRRDFEIVNNSDKAVPVTLVARPISTSFNAPCDPSAGCTVGWALDGKPLRANSGTHASVPADGILTLSFAGTTPRQGTYQSEVAVRTSGAKQVDAVRVRMVRTSLDLGDGAITIGPAGRLTWRLPLGEVPAVPVMLHNAASESATVVSKLVANLYSDDGTGAYSEQRGTAQIICPAPTSTAARNNDDAGTLEIPASGDIQCSLQMDGRPTAGRYRATLALSGPDLVRKQASADLSVRYPLLFCLALLIAGGWLGAKVAGYQNSGRRRALQMADVLELREIYTSIQHDLATDTAPGARGEVDDILLTLDQYRGDLDTKRDADFAGHFEPLRRRAPFLHRFGLIEPRYHDADKATQDEVKAAYDAARAAIKSATVPQDARQTLDDLDAALPPSKAAALGEDGTVPPYPEFFFQIWRTHSAEQLRSHVRRRDDAALVAGIVLASLIGVLTLWVPSSAWGSLGDILLALFTGATAALTGAIGLQELLKGYPLGRLGAGK